MSQLYVHLTSDRSCFVDLPLSITQNLTRLDTVVFALKLNNGETIYANWSGRNCNDGIINIPFGFSSCYNILDNSIIKVEILYSSVIEKMLFLEPVSEDDWEILELNSLDIELNLLSQINIVTLGKKFIYYIRNTQKIYLKAISSSSEKLDFVRLSTSSEIAISPKIRRLNIKDESIKDSKSSCFLLRVQPTLTPYLEPSMELIHTVFVSHQSMMIFAPDKSPSLVSLYIPSNSTSFNQNDMLVPSDYDVSSLKYYNVNICVSDDCADNHIILSEELRLYLQVPLFSQLLISNSSDRPVEMVSIKSITLLPIYFSVHEIDAPEYDWNEVVLSFKKFIPDAPPLHNNALISLTIGNSVTVFSIQIYSENYQPNHLFSLSSCLCSKVKISDLIFTKNINDSGICLIVSKTIKMPLFSDNPCSDALRRLIYMNNISPLESLGAIEHVIENVYSNIALLFDSKSSLIRNSIGSKFLYPGNNILVGNQCSGKSSILAGVSLKIRHRFAVHIIIIQNLKFQGSIANIKRYLSEVCNEAKIRRPCLIIFDDIDKSISNLSEHDTNANSKLNQISELFLDTFSKLINSCNLSNSGHVAILATATKSHKVHPLLFNPPLFCNLINIPSLSSYDRVVIFKKITDANKINCKFDLSQIAECEGYSASDLKYIYQRILHFAAIKSTEFGDSNVIELTQDDFNSSRNGFVPASMRDIPMQTSAISWTDIGGLETVRSTLKETLEMPNKYGKIFEKAPIKLRSGILLYGPPGCGKTLLASAIAKECGLNFISVKGPELLSKYIGSSEASVREVFGRAAAAAPCIIFFDEFEAIAPRRGGDSTGVTDRVVNQLLCHLDGVEGRNGIYVLAATSRPDLIDPALLRPGRFDKHLYCGFPNKAERFDILKCITNKVNLGRDVRLDELAEKTDMYTGADLQGIVTSAQLLVIHEVLEVKIEVAKSQTSSNESENIEITPNLLPVASRHFIKALTDSRLSTSKKDRDRFEKIYSNFSGFRPDFKDHNNKSTAIGSRTSLA